MQIVSAFHQEYSLNRVLTEISHYIRLVAVERYNAGLKLQVCQCGSAKAEQITAQWKGANASGENVKNYIGGQFVDSQTEKWMDVIDPVCLHHPHVWWELIVVATVDANSAVSCSGDNPF